MVFKTYIEEEEEETHFESDKLFKLINEETEL